MAQESFLQKNKFPTPKVATQLGLFKCDKMIKMKMLKMKKIMKMASHGSITFSWW